CRWQRQKPPRDSLARVTCLSGPTPDRPFCSAGWTSASTQAKPRPWACSVLVRRRLAPRPLLARLDAACGTGAARAAPPARAQLALPRHVVDLDADAVGILEEDRVVARGKLRAVFRRGDDAAP